MAEIRVFIAALLTADLKAKIKAVQDRFRQADPDVKWVAAENFHVTLKFLGDVAEDRLESVCRAVEAAAAGVRPFAVTVSGAGTFPNPRRPRVVWVGLGSGFDQLAALAGRVESELAGIGFPKEDRRFSAHVTIGRVRDNRRTDALAEALESADVGEIGAVDVSAVAVMRSDLRREGPIYSVLREVQLESP